MIRSTIPACRTASLGSAVVLLGLLAACDLTDPIDNIPGDGARFDVTLAGSTSVLTAAPVTGTLSDAIGVAATSPESGSTTLHLTFEGVGSDGTTGVVALVYRGEAWPGIGTHAILPPPASPWELSDGGFRVVYTRVDNGRVRMFSAEGGNVEITESSTEFVKGDIQFQASTYVEIPDRGDSGVVMSTDSIVTGSEELNVSGSFSVIPSKVHLEQPSCSNPGGSSDCVPENPSPFDTSTFGDPYQLILPRVGAPAAAMDTTIFVTPEVRNGTLFATVGYGGCSEGTFTVRAGEGPGGSAWIKVWHEYPAVAVDCALYRYVKLALALPEGTPDSGPLSLMYPNIGGDPHDDAVTLR